MLQQIYPSTTHPYQFELNRNFNFSTAHHTPCEEAGICQNVHGHTYFVNLTIIGDKLDDTGFLMNFSHLEKMIHGRFDHQLLNSLSAFKNKIPSTEIVAEITYQIVKKDLASLGHQPKCIQVFVRETPINYIIFRPEKQVQLMAKIPVLKILGPTIQGEDRIIGRKTMFVRAAGYNYRCSWCDSAFTWDGSAKGDIKLMTAGEICDESKQTGGDLFSHVTISSGNPALIKGIQELVDLFQDKGTSSALETQGSKFQPWMTQVDDLTINPKPPSSTMTPDLKKSDEVITQYVPSLSNLKIVAFDGKNYDFAKIIHHRYPDIPSYLQVGNPYLSDSVDSHTEKLLERYEQLVDLVMQSSDMNHVYMLPQLHTLPWSNKKSV